MSSNVQFVNRGNRGEIWLYDSIGGGFFGGITADDFRKQLTALGKVDSINVRINSGGGEVFDGMAIYNSLKNHPARISVDIDGWAASIASVIAMAADPGQLRMASNALMMIHRPHGVAIGDSVEMQRTSALLDKVQFSIVDTYRQRTGHAADTIDAWMSETKWFSASEAVENGFADTATEEQPVMAYYLEHDRDDCNKVPEAFRRRLVPHASANPTDDMFRVRIHQQALRLKRLSA